MLIPVINCAEYLMLTLIQHRYLYVGWLRCDFGSIKAKNVDEAQSAFHLVTVTLWRLVGRLSL